MAGEPKFSEEQRAEIERLAVDEGMTSAAVIGHISAGAAAVPFAHPPSMSTVDRVRREAFMRDGGDPEQSGGIPYSLSRSRRQITQLHSEAVDQLRGLTRRNPERWVLGRDLQNALKTLAQTQKTLEDLSKKAGAPKPREEQSFLEELEEKLRDSGDVLAELEAGPVDPEVLNADAGPGEP